MIIRKFIMIFLLVSISVLSRFAAQISWAGDSVNASVLPVELIAQQAPRDSLPEIVGNGYQRVYTTTTIPVTIEQLDELRQAGKTPDIDPETGSMIIESFRDYLPEGWTQEGDAPEKLTDSYGNPIVNQTPGLADWAQRDVDALRLEIENSLEKYWSATASELREIEWVLGNFISQAIVRKIEFKDLVELSNRNVVSDRVADSIIEYLHFYENLKYSRSLGGRLTYSVSEYDESIEAFVKSRGQTLDQVVMLENPDVAPREAAPSGCYTKSTFTREMGLLSSPTVLYDGSTGTYNDESAEIPIGFYYVFYGCDDYDYNDFVRVSTNGYIYLYQQGGDILPEWGFVNASIPSPNYPDGYAAAWWDDMIVKNQGTTDKISYKTEGAFGSRIFTVQYFSISRRLGVATDYYYYQIKLFEYDGSIEFHYGDWGGDSGNDNATIGLENYAGTDGDCGPNCGNTNAARPPYNYLFVPNYNIWYGWQSTAWDNVDNWEPNRLPTNAINVVIQDRENDPVVDSSEGSCASLNVLSDAVVTTAGLAGGHINVFGNIINDGTIQSNGAHFSDIEIESDCTISGGGSWIDLFFNIYGTTNLTTSLATESIQCLSTAVFNTGGNTITTSGNLYNLGTINAGTTHWYIGGNFSGSGTFNAGASEVDFNGSADSHISGSPIFYDLDINKTSGATTYLDTDVDVLYKLYAHSGILDINGHALTSADSYIYGNLINDTGTFTITGNELYFLSGSNYICSAGVVNCTGDIYFDGGSSETISGGTISLAGSFFADGSNFTPTGGSVVFKGKSGAGIGGSPDFFDLAVEKSLGSTIFGMADFTVVNSLDIVSGVFDPNGYTVTVGE